MISTILPPIKLPAIKVQQPLGEFFAVGINARFLRQVVFLDPTRIQSVDRSSFFYKLIGNQREASLPRARKISEYINSIESAFPNSVILAANYNDQGALLEDDETRWRIETENGLHYVVIPTDGRVASVIDGQHRLLGFDFCKEERRDMDLLCSVYVDLPLAYQAYLFATININQRKVDKSLAYEQFGYNLDEEEPKSWAPDKLAVFFTRRLNLNPDSPLHRHIKIAPLESDLVFDAVADAWQVSTACIVEGLLSLFSSRPKTDRDLLHAQHLVERNRKNLPQDNSPLRDEYRFCEDDKILKLTLHFLKEVSFHLWNKAKKTSYIRKTIGIQGLFDVFRIIALKTPREDLESRLSKVFSSAANVDFSDQFFQASGKGRVRVKNAVLNAAGELREDDVHAEDYVFYRQIAPPATMDAD